MSFGCLVADISDSCRFGEFVEFVEVSNILGRRGATYFVGIGEHRRIVYYWHVGVFFL